MMIDIHTHLSKDPSYADRMVEAEKAIGVDKFATFGAGPDDAWATNDQVLAAAEKYPDMIIPFAYVHLGKVTTAQITSLVKRGFKGFKCINPAKPYNDDSFMKIYARIAEHNVPVLFHTGIVGRFSDQSKYDVDTYRNKVIFLDRAARKFGTLNIVGAHLGNPDYGEAAMMMRWHPNLYFDLSGSSLKANPPEFFGKLFWWHAPETPGGKRVLGSYNNDPRGRGPWQKIVF
jgi:uncharacterized protein